MIVLDEELQGLGLEAAIGRRYRGAVILIKQLRPDTVIKDEAIPTFASSQTAYLHYDQSPRLLAARAR